jgi:hypothetical protein
VWRGLPSPAGDALTWEGGREQGRGPGSSRTAVLPASTRATVRPAPPADDTGGARRFGARGMEEELHVRRAVERVRPLLLVRGRLGGGDGVEVRQRPLLPVRRRPA